MHKHHRVVTSTSCPCSVTTVCPTFSTRGTGVSPTFTLPTTVSAPTSVSVGQVTPTGQATVSTPELASLAQQLGIPSLAGLGTDPTQALAGIPGIGTSGIPGISGIPGVTGTSPAAIFANPISQLGAINPFAALAAANPNAALAALSPALNIFNPAVNPNAALLQFNPAAAPTLALSGKQGLATLPFGKSPAGKAPFAKPFGKFPWGVV